MSPTHIAKAADLLQALGQDVSIRSVCRTLKAATGKAARWSQVRAVLRAWESGEFSERATPGQHPGTVGQHFDEERATPGQQGLPARGKGNSKPYISSDTKVSSEQPPLFEPEPKATKARKNGKVADISWRVPVIEAAKALADSKRQMRSWSADERFAWARFHCLTFGGCTRSEPTNLSKATNVAAALLTMALSRDYGDMTGGEYFHLARTVHDKLRGGKPWLDPWLIKAAVEISAEA